MPLMIHVVVILIVTGIMLWAIESIPQISASIKPLIRVVIIVAALLWVLQVFGLLGHLGAPLR